MATLAANASRDDVVTICKGFADQFLPDLDRVLQDYSGKVEMSLRRPVSLILFSRLKHSFLLQYSFPQVDLLLRRLPEDGLDEEGQGREGSARDAEALAQGPEEPARVGRDGPASFPSPHALVVTSY